MPELKRLNLLTRNRDWKCKMRRRLNKKRTFRSAMALVAALWVSVLMMALVSVAAQSSLLDSRISQIENEKQRSRWACRAGIETAIGLLLVDDRTYDSWVDLWSYNPQELENMDFGGVTVTVEVVDASIGVSSSGQYTVAPVTFATGATAPT